MADRVTKEDLQEHLASCFGCMPEELVGQSIESLLIDADNSGGLVVFWKALPAWVYTDNF